MLELAAADPSLLRGRIVFERASYCDYVVVETAGGFAFFATDANIIAVAGARWVTGPLTARGRQVVDIDGRATLAVRILAWDEDLPHAKARFDHYCDPAWLDLGSGN